MKSIETKLMGNPCKASAKFLLLGSVFFAFGVGPTQSEQTRTSRTKLISSLERKYTPHTLSDQVESITFTKPSINTNKADCDIFDAPRSVACIGPEKNYQPNNTLERAFQKGATYATRFVPMLNRQADGSEYSDLIINDGQNLIFDTAQKYANSTANEKIQSIPFFAQTTISLNIGSQGDQNSRVGFSLDSLLKLKEIDRDSEGDLKTLLFGQTKFSLPSKGDGTTTNYGVGIRHRPDDHSMLGANAFLDYRRTSYSTAHSRFGLGGEYLWKHFELRNNWYMAVTGKRDVTVNGTSYVERVVPGWDVELGYRLPNYPELGFFVRGFNWDYEDTQDNNGLEGSLNWQASPHMNIEAWVSNEISALQTKANSTLPATDETFYGIRMKFTAKPVSLRKNRFKENMITQMTQPVRRQYDVLIERSTGGFSNRATGS